MPVINGVYLKDFAALPGAVDDANIIPIAISGNQVAYRTTVAGIITDARITSKLLTGLIVTGGSVVATDTILEAFGKVQNQINNRVNSGGSSVNYYLNGSVPASVGTYYQMDNTPVIGTGTDFTLTGNGLIAQFLTDANNPNRLLIPAGAWNFEMYFQVSSAGGSAKFYVELLKYNGSTFTSIASSSAVPEEITNGTTIDLYVTSIAVPETALLITDRLAIRVYIVDNSGGRTVTLHTEDNTLCQIVTSFAGGISALNGLTANTQYFAVGSTGTDFNIVSTTDTHTFNIPSASASNRGLITTGTQTIAGSKTFTSTINANAVNTAIIQSNNNTTGIAYIDLLNTSASARYGIENSTGGGIFTGSTAYATVLGTGNATNLEFFTANILRATITSAGIFNIAGQLQLGSTITNGTYTYTLPSATGTLALTSALSGYLPLSGGTLTGVLYGTSAEFSAGIFSQTAFFGTRSKSQSLFVGFGSGNSGMSGVSNTFIGDLAGNLATTGSSNTLIGRVAGTAQTTASGNTLIGQASGVSLTTGGNNTFLGSDAGSGITTGTGNTILGLSGVIASSSLTNNIILASGAGIKAQYDDTNWNFAGGAVFTGALSGTSATFSDNITCGNATNSENLVVINGSTYSGLKLQRNSVNKWAVFNNNAGTDFFDVYNYGTSSSALKINPTTNQVTFIGDVTITGALSKGSGSFRINHPLESLSETHQLVHSFVEAPKADLIYRGKITLVNGKGQANIDEIATMTDGTFDVLCRDIQCFTTNESGWDLVKGKVIGSIIYIESQNENSLDEISWMVIAERKDKHMMETNWTDENGRVIVEPLKQIEENILTN